MRAEVVFLKAVRSVLVLKTQKGECQGEEERMYELCLKDTRRLLWRRLVWKVGCGGDLERQRETDEACGCLIPGTWETRT